MNFSRISNKIINLKNQIYFDLGVPFTKINSNCKNLIFMYHGISTNRSNPFNARHTYIKDFENQIKYFKKHFNILTVKDFFDHKIDDSKLNIAITFDDGYLNNLQYALPILEKYQVPVSIYTTCLFEEDNPYIWADFLQIATFYGKDSYEFGGELYYKKGSQYLRFIDHKSLLSIVKNEKPDYEFKKEIYHKLNYVFERFKSIHFSFWKLMDHDDLIEISKSKYVTIGSHGFYHNNLGVLKLENAENEIRSSKKTLENIIQKEIEEIAYPDGSFNEKLINSATSLGLHYQLGTENNEINNFKNHPNIKGRKGIYQCSSWGNQLL